MVIDEGWYPSPFEEENRALKADYPSRIVSFIDWIRPRTTDFQDVEFGEGFNGLNDGAGRLFPDGPPVGVYVEDPHFHVYKKLHYGFSPLMIELVVICPWTKSRT
jgi:hypothetical protein